MEIRLSRIRGAPRRIKATLGFSFHAKKVYSPSGTRIEVLSQATHRNCHISCPDFCVLFYFCTAGHSALWVGPFAVFDIQIDPKAIWTDFELKVVAGISWIGLDKNLNDVAIPKVVASA